MSQISEIRFNLWVPDVRASLAFFSSLEIFEIEDISAGAPRVLVTYEADKLRFTVEINQPLNDQGAVHIGSMAPAAYPRLSFNIGDFEAFEKWHAKMLKNRVQVSPVLELPYGKYVHVADPFGNIFAFSASHV